MGCKLEIGGILKTPQRQSPLTRAHRRRNCDRRFFLSTGATAANPIGTTPACPSSTSPAYSLSPLLSTFILQFILTHPVFTRSIRVTTNLVAWFDQAPRSCAEGFGHTRMRPSYFILHVWPDVARPGGLESRIDCMGSTCWIIATVAGRMNHVSGPATVQPSELAHRIPR